MQNTSTDPFVSRVKWSPDRPQTLVVCCSDGRWHAPILEYVHHEVSDRADLYAVPGGPAVVDPWSSSFEEARVLERALHMFEEHHDLTGVWLIQHEGCAYYRVKHPGQRPDDVMALQIADLHRAVRHLRERRPRFAVRAVMATLDGDRAVFTTIPVAASDAWDGQVRTTLL